jgi:transcriptional regulator with PAS, ATPase and Fis domain
MMSNIQDVKGEGANYLGNAMDALVVLKAWLSVSESQICSTEVLSSHLPKINDLLESSMNQISAHFSNVAAAASEIDKEVSKISDEVDVIDVDGKKVHILEYISAIAKDTKDSDTAKKLSSLVDSIKSQEDSLHAEIKNTKKALEKNAAELNEIVVGMQFQDRVSQNIIITINIMKAVTEYLDKEIEIALPAITRDDRKKLLNKEFAMELLQKFRLGELQHSFVEHLVSHGYIGDSSELGFSAGDLVTAKKDDDEVELF